MSIFYSSGCRGFFSDDIHDHLPEDSVPVADDVYHGLLEAQAQGKTIVPGVDGKPIAADAEPPSVPDQLALLRVKRDRLLKATDFTQIADYPITDEERADWASYRQALRDLPALYAADPSSAEWPQPPSGDEA